MSDFPRSRTSPPPACTLSSKPMSSPPAPSPKPTGGRPTKGLPASATGRTWSDPWPPHLALPWTYRVFTNLKRWALGVYHGLRDKHLSSYLDAFVFRLYGALGVKLRMWMPYSFLCQRLGGGRLAALCTTV